MNKLKTQITTFLKALILITILNSCQSQAQDNKATKINEIISLYSDYGGFNGSVLVSHKGKTIYKNGFGLANMEWDIPNQVTTKFRIASITKPFTAILIMQLVADNKLDLHKPITTYLPNYPKEKGDKITIHQLLSHTSGITRNYESTKKKNKYPDRYQLIDLVNEFSELPLEFEPGEKFAYSNTGYLILGHLIEQITEKSFETVLQEKILTPLKMKNTGSDKHRPLIKNRAKGYFKSFGEYYNADFIDMSSITAVGNIYSTVEDLFLLDQALYTETILPKKYIDLMFKKHILDPDYGHYGYGWELISKPIGNTSNKIETIGHSGSIGGARALVTRIPSSNSSIIFLNNTSRAFLSSMTTAITGILNDQPYDFPIKPLAMFMTREIKEKGIEKGIAYYKEHQHSSDYHISEQELIVEGYRLLHADNAEDAAKVFKLSTEVFPNADNAYDSYAEALMTLGKNEEAIKNYKKSVQLNPKNENGKKMLKKLGYDIEKENLDLLITEKSWGKEVIPFPPHYASELAYKGVEEAYFPKGWRKPKSPEFWSFAFAWNVNITEKLTTAQLEVHIQAYYDGLMNVVNKNKELTPPKTVAKLNKIEATATMIKHKGTVNIFDAFATNKPLMLNAIIEQHYCKKQEKYLLVFKFSPKPFNHTIWKTIHKVKLNENSCDF